jgi:hypothetical protein
MRREPETRAVLEQQRLYRTGKDERWSIARLAMSILLVLYADRFILRLYH